MKLLSTVITIFIFAPLAALGQTVTTDALSTTVFCEGATVTVNYTANGSFGAKNVFTVQLSASDGTFSPSFSNIGSVKSTGSGSIQATLPSTAGKHYRLRVTASNPYTIGNDNGTDIEIDAPPGWMGFGVSKRIALIGDTVVFDAEDYPTGTTFQWNFGSDANPQTSSGSPVAVVFSNAGVKDVKLEAAVNSPCISGPMDTSDIVAIFGCTPSIRSNSYIDSVPSNENAFPGSNDIWVVPGGALQLGSFDAGPWMATPRSIFAEAGSTISGGRGHVIYLKPGAVYSGGDNIIIYSSGASTSGGLECGSLSFDYSNAPPYKIAGASVNNSNNQASKVLVYPDPAINLVTIESPEVPNSIIVRNDLGDILLMDNGPIATNHLQFDVSHFVPGVYYVELTVGGHSTISKFTISR